MTRVVRAASTTSLVTKVSSLMLRIRWIWTNSRWMSRKLPLVIRAIAAMAWASLKSAVSSSSPSLRQCWVRTKVSSSLPSGR